MRTTLVAMLVVMAACTGPSDGPKGDDTDPVDTEVPSETDTVVDTVPSDTDAVDSDDTDEGGPVVPGPDVDGFFGPEDSTPPVYTDVTPFQPFRRWTFEGRPVISSLPDPLLGVVFVFHGTGGGADVAESTEMMAVLNEMLRRNIGFVATTSADRSAKVWNVQAGTGSNPDWNYVVDVRDAMIADGDLDAATPLFGLGYSQGGNFAGYFAHAAVAARWPIQAIALHQSTGRSQLYGDPPLIPVAFMPAEHDETVEPGTIESVYTNHVASAGVARLWPFREERLAPTRWVRSGSITVPQSNQLWQLAVDEGYYDDMGYRLFPEDEITARVDTFSALPEVRYPRPTKAVLSVVLATHALNGQHAVAEARFFVGQLP